MDWPEVTHHIDTEHHALYISHHYCYKIYSLTCDIIRHDRKMPSSPRTLTYTQIRGGLFAEFSTEELEDKLSKNPLDLALYHFDTQGIPVNPPIYVTGIWIIPPREPTEIGKPILYSYQANSITFGSEGDIMYRINDDGRIR